VRVSDGFGGWKDGQHVVGPRNARMEHELYGEAGDGQHQVSHLGRLDRALDITEWED
jgi:ATP-dependent RNA helicase DDX3X